MRSSLVASFAGMASLILGGGVGGCSRRAEPAMTRESGGAGGATTGGVGAGETSGTAASGTAGMNGGSGDQNGGHPGGGTSGKAGGAAGDGATAGGLGGSPTGGSGGMATSGSSGGPTGGSGGASGPEGVSGNWTLVFQDEFTTGAVPSASTYNFYPVWGDNNNPQEDTAFRQGETNPTTGLGGLSASAATVSDGRALLTASRTATRYAGYDWPYRGVWIRTKTEYLYGYFEVRAKVAAGQGLWTTLWLMPDPYDENEAWEIDIAEFPGTGALRAHQNIHWGVFADSNQDLSNAAGDYSTAFHTYGVHWEASQVQWYVDGALVKTHTAHVPNVPMQLICFLEVGGPAGWVGTFDGSTPLPRATEIEYLRIYREN